MGLAIVVKFDLNPLRQLLGAQQRQVTFAAAHALTQVAKETAVAVSNELPGFFDRPTPFTLRAIASQGANRSSLTARIYIRPIQAAYLGYQIAGGVRKPKKKALVLPTDFPVDQYGNLPRNAVKQLLRRKDVFSGTVRGVGGIWQRVGRKLLLLISYETQATYRKRFPFADRGLEHVRRLMPAQMRESLLYALRTAR